ncbi:MAG: hypothetical protein CDV28_1111, partial [Candidatus Electronema aureum]
FHKNGVWLAGIRPLKTETKSEVNFFNIILFLMVNSMCFLGSRPLCHSWFTITLFRQPGRCFHLQLCKLLKVG